MIPPYTATFHKEQLQIIRNYMTDQMVINACVHTSNLCNVKNNMGLHIERVTKIFPTSKLR
jgi:hypothetical protein